MKRTLLLAAATLGFAACNNSKMNWKYDAHDGNSNAANKKAMTSSLAAKQNPHDSNRKFIRTADLKFRVKNVLNATYAIEDAVSRQGGFVTLTQLNSNVEDQNLTPVSEDSSLESKTVNVVNSMVIRVPNTRLDTTLKSIAFLVDFMDYRTIKADDVSLQLLANDLAKKRETQLHKNLSKDIAAHGKKLKETTEAELTANDRQEQADSAQLNNLAMNDKIEYSTIDLDIYQRPEFIKILVPNEKNIPSFEPGMGSRLASAFHAGWNVFEDILVFLVRIWWLFVLGIGLFALTRYYRYQFGKSE